LIIYPKEKLMDMQVLMIIVFGCLFNYLFGLIAGSLYYHVKTKQKISLWGWIALFLGFMVTSVIPLNLLWAMIYVLIGVYKGWKLAERVFQRRR